MAGSPTSKFIQHFRGTLPPLDEASLTDGQLLECFIIRQDEAAFAALMRRHGPMVWGVCRRVLSGHQDAEDAFQATFLVLVRKAASLASRELLANWLYGVAHRIALKAKAATAKRQMRERQVTEMPEPEAVPQAPWHDLLPLLDQVLSNLPNKYRIPIVLCDLEGKTRKEVARQIGCPEGTVAGRLARARTMLAKRLARHGAVISVGSLAVMLAEVSASASAPISVVSSTIATATLVAAGQAAMVGLISANVAALTQGVLKAMLLTKLKTVFTAILLSVGVIALGGLAAHHIAAGQQTKTADQADAPKKDASKADLKRIQGTWRAVSGSVGGAEVPFARTPEANKLCVFWADNWTTSIFKGGAAVTFKLDATKNPRAIDLHPTGGKETTLGIYELDGDNLKICYCIAGAPGVPAGKQERPSKFADKADVILLVLKRHKIEE